MPLFHIQDDDRPCWVVAASWNDALEQWRDLIAEENDGDRSCDPQGVHYICGDDELLMPSGLYETPLADI